VTDVAATLEELRQTGLLREGRVVDAQVDRELRSVSPSSCGSVSGESL